jgi:hypothetical protein
MMNQNHHILHRNAKQFRCCFGLLHVRTATCCIGLWHLVSYLSNFNILRRNYSNIKCVSLNFFFFFIYISDAESYGIDTTRHYCKKSTNDSKF